LAIPLALVLGVSAILLLRRGHQPQPAPEVSAHPLLRRSVAVVGLQNLNADPSDRWLSTALEEMLSAELSASESLRVIPGEEVARVGLAEAPANTPSRETLARYAHLLGAEMIVYGSFAVTHPLHRGGAGDSLRLDLRLENFSSDAPSLILIKTGKSSDLFDLVTASGSDLRQRLGLEALSSEASSAVRKSLPADATAAQFYAEGLNRLHLFDALGARDLLQKAARIEPGHAGTHLALSDAWNGLGFDSEALREVQTAVKLSEGLPRQQSLVMQGQLATLLNDGPHATEIFRSLFTFYPDNVDYGLRLATAQDLAGNTKDALATLKSLNWAGIPDVDRARNELLRSKFDLFLGNFQAAFEGSERADRIGQALGLNLIRAQSLQQKASALERQSKASESLAASALAEGFYKAAGDMRGQAFALLMSGDVQYDSGKLSEARSTFESALVLFRDVGHKRGAGITLERIGNVRYDQGALAESRRYYSMALGIYRELRLDGTIASAIGNIANVQDSEGDIVGAIDSNNQGLTLFERTGNQRGVAVTLSNIGNLEMERGALNMARGDFDRSEVMNRKIGYTRGLAFSLVGEGDVLVAQNDLSGGIRLYQQALKVLAGADEPEVLTNVHRTLGFAELLQGQPQVAIKDLQLAVDLAIKRGDHGNAVLALSGLTRAEVAAGNIPDAATNANRTVAESKLQFAPQMNLIASLAHARSQVAMGQKAAAQNELRVAVAGAQRCGYLPLALEARILLARTTGPADNQRRLLNSLAEEALTHGWAQLAADARRT
jgi:tetratricopeptide (TPR) repeat protein